MKSDQICELLREKAQTGIMNLLNNHYKEKVEKTKTKTKIR